ncbi:MAG TPA: hypothetical protein VGD65_22895 [Chryseosolibacter sp.]
MTEKELADYIRENKGGKSFYYSTRDNSVILQHIRTVLYAHVHITDEHVFESCHTAKSYEEFVELCRPLARADTEVWLREWKKPPPKGRTRRRFR